ncbi:uncharacterized protein GGS22DRAFT_44508 [Annulohypoxylon maeteangense]|uniref:uncharacterized protein n=1 Tax=Annulohypoxylon maeteangense TaxID=1927788 RepID=UPI0020078035|nr:uncharacterized protein GGS22DRAFT_44508 [Annulohypoxylon maeteangense]KAI0882456.1 hypothetical protein GGS22DRAFT_44508 [Annulohypoxylon maeteangense]
MPSHQHYSGPDEPRNPNPVTPSYSPGHDPTTFQPLNTEKQSSPLRTSFSEDIFDSMRNLSGNAVGPTNPDAPWLTLASSSVNHVNLKGGGLDAIGVGISPSVARDVQSEKHESRRGTTGAGTGARRKSKEVSITGDPPEIIDNKLSINEYRAQLAKEMERREQAVRTSPSPTRNASEETRVSPIKEESSTTPSPTTTDSDIPTASTESNRTVRGGMTPGFSARTPSYPFPRMTTPNFSATYLQHVLNQQPPTGAVNPAGAQFGGFVLQDQIRSDPSTPASAMTFLPTGVATKPSNLDFPTPSLYDLSLMLSAEPGLEAWWNTVVQIMTDYYKAERVTLSVPADPTDVENVPWGQKATYNALEEDDMSMVYLAKGTAACSEGDPPEPRSSSEDPNKGSKPTRPAIQSRHSFTAYEDQIGNREVNAEETASSNAQRPGLVQRSKSYYPGTDKLDPTSPHPTLNRQTLEEHDAIEEQQPVPTWEAKMEPTKDGKGRLLQVLQGLDFEADPLIDHDGITRVVERGKVIALTRTYPYLDPTSEEKQQQSKIAKPVPAEDHRKQLSSKFIRSESQTKLSTLLASAGAPRSLSRNRKSLSVDKKIPSLYSTFDDVLPRPPTPKYEEYEQAPPSPWSQSPAPSPAVRADPSENPFFTDAVVDEESFNPGPSPHDYTSTQPPEAIGVDNSWTVLHIPLNHVLLSKPPQKFKLDPSALEQKASQRSHSEPIVNPAMLHERPSTEELAKKNKNLPIAILSILTPIIPYPANLRHSLEHLAPHLAATFSLCRHYSNLETEVMGIHRKRPSTSGFGAIGPDGRPVTDPIMLTRLNAPSPGDVSQRSVTGSLTSPSEYSGPSRSINASPSGTPLWESNSFGLVVERRTTGASPNQPGGDSYFSSVPRSGNIPAEVIAQRASRTGTKESGLTMAKQLRRSGSLLHHQQDLNSIMKDTEGSDIARNSGVFDEATLNQISKQRPASKDSSDINTRVENQQSQQDVDDSRRRLSNQSMQSGGHRHTLLHSYGGDFSSSFQSLPPSTSLLTKPTSQPPTPIRPGSASAPQVTMLPPSDRLKGLMLDLLPVHVFVALPVHGEIVWVNSRYLTYRGQTLADLVADPWGSLHPEDREEYMRAWGHSLRSGDQFAQSVRLRRFDGAYRWHQARAVASRDKRGVIVQFIGSYMDIHDQKVAELMALRQEEIEISEAKHRLLANLIPQIIFTATENDGITFANEQWLSYTGQSDEDALGLGFIDFVHPDDLAKCRLPAERSAATTHYNEETKVDISIDDYTSTGIKSLLTSAYEKQPEILSQNMSSASARDFVTADLGELFRQGILKVATDSNGRLSYTTEVRLRSKSGEYRWHLIRCVEIDDVVFGSGASSYFGSATDINDHKLLEGKLKEAMESKGRFLSNMSHEIRTPLIGISGMVSFLQDTILNEEQRDYTNTIQTSANSLLMIINDILDLSKVDAGMMKLNFEWFHTRSLIEDVNELVSTMAIAKRLELNYIVEENVPSWVKGDKVRIRQVLLNVIGNAIKFTAAGEVFSRCRVYACDALELGEHQIMLEFSVIDTGRGFSKEEAELIFKPFSQIDGSSTRQHGGSGLGLVISRQLVELHGGRMDGTAVPGKGSTFTFTAKFGLPSSEDHPSVISTPPMTASMRSPMEGKPTHAIKPLLLHRTMDSVSTASPSSDVDVSSPALESSGSSDPSLRSIRTQDTIRSSVSSVNVGLSHFSEAAKASGQDISQMKLEMPSGKMSPQMMPTPDGTKFPTDLIQFRPPMYSILIICPQTYSREATKKHIEMTLPKDVPHQITAMASVSEAKAVIGGHESVTFTHIVLNLPSAEEIVGVVDMIIASSGGKTSVLVLTDSVQRQAVLKLASDAEHQQLLAEKRIMFIYKPVKPSRFAVIFDPGRERDLSVDLNRSSAAQMVENQKQSYLDVEKRIGNKGYKVLLVEDNPVNQKVLVRYLRKVGIEAEIAADGVECTEKVFAQPPYYYSLILCDLHMPRKDGYQACREIRQWEEQANLRKLPIIALSANVMSDVQEKCAAAGFNDYVTKPVDFVDLSTAMSKFF